MRRKGLKLYLLQWVVAGFALASWGMPTPANAQVMLRFHSVTGSFWGFGRYPHAFIELIGTLDSTGRKIHENFGYSAASVTPALLTGNVKAIIEHEKDDYIPKTNLHFSIPVSDAQVAAIEQEVAKWADAPGNAYNLNSHNCINFVARIAELVGLKVDVPAAMQKQPKAWLNHIAEMNPQLHAALVR